MTHALGFQNPLGGYFSLLNWKMPFFLNSTLFDEEPQNAYYARSGKHLGFSIPFCKSLTPVDGKPIRYYSMKNTTEAKPFL